MAENSQQEDNKVKTINESKMVDDTNVEHDNTHLGIKWAPLNIPFERRKQTAAVLFFLILCTCSIGWVCGMGYLLLFYTKDGWMLTSLYLAWWAYDFNTCNMGGRRWNWFRNLFLWKLCRDYFPVNLVKTAELDPNRNYICGSHPHGLLCLGVGVTSCTPFCDIEKTFPNIYFRLLTLREFYIFPGLREIMLAMGMSAATKENLDAILGAMHNGLRPKGQATIIVVGGAREVLRADITDRIVLVILKRKGFIKKALQYGADLVPMFTFNETFLADPMFPDSDGKFIKIVQEWVTTVTRWPLPYFMGRGIFQYSFGLLPKRLPLTVVVGKPINVEEFGIPPGGCQPTQEQIDTVHEAYLKALRDIYDKYNPIYGRKGMPLQFG